MRAVFIICFLLLVSAPGCLQAQTPNVTSYQRMTADLSADAARCPALSISSLGTSAHGHKNIWIVRVQDPSIKSADTLRLMVLCRQHGDEPASTEAILGLLRGFARGHDPSLGSGLKSVTLYIVPMVNPDGADALTRTNGAGADLNRDWGVFSQPETRAINRAVELIRPHVIVDAHNWDGDDPYNANSIEVTRDQRTPLGAAALALQRSAVDGLAANGYQVNQIGYGADSVPGLAHRYFTRRGYLSFLVETHSGDPNDVADFERRQGLYTALIHSLVRQFAADSSSARLTIERLEGNRTRMTQEASIFAAPTAVTTPRSADTAVRKAMPAWAWAICVYGAALWLVWICRRAPVGSSSNVVKKPGSHRADNPGRYSLPKRSRPKFRCGLGTTRFRAVPELAKH